MNKSRKVGIIAHVSKDKSNLSAIVALLMRSTDSKPKV